MSSLCHLLFLAILAAAGCPDDADSVVRNEKLNFEIRRPSGSLDWVTVSTPKLDAHFRTDGAEVQLMVRPGSPTESLERIAGRWKDAMESWLTKVESRTAAPGRIAGEACHVVNVRGEQDGAAYHLTWMLTRRDAHLYVLYILRSADAIGGARIEAEIAAIRDSFRFLRKKKPVAKPKADPALARREIPPDHWRFACVKPEGVREVEQDAGAVLQLEGVKEQSRLVIRVWARLPGGESMKRRAEKRRAEFEAEVPKHGEPAIDRKWKPPLAKRTLRMRLTGLRRTKVVVTWLFAECRNRRNYDIQIAVAGPGDWSKTIDAFLSGFRPVKKPTR